MKCALAAVGFINEDIEYNKAVLADTLRKCAGRADVVIFGEAFLQGFYGINFIAKHDTTVSISRDDMIIREICSMAKEYAIAVSFGFIEKEDDVFFSSQMTIDKNGQIIDLYRRVSPGWKESFAGKEYCEGDGFHTFHLLGRVVAIGLCGDLCNGVQREHNKKLNNGLPILHKVPPKRDYGRHFCIMAEKGGTSHGGLTEKLSPFFHAKKQEVNAYGR